jgi:hypothetical protein
MRRAEGGAKIFGIFRVKNHDFTPKNHIFSNCGGRCEIFGVFRVKNHHFTPKNHIFSNFRGGGGAPPGSAPADEKQRPSSPTFIKHKISKTKLNSRK